MTTTNNQFIAAQCDQAGESVMLCDKPAQSVPPASGTTAKALIERLRHTASKGVSVWGDLQIEAANEIEILLAEVEVYASSMDRMKSAAIAQSVPTASGNRITDSIILARKVVEDAKFIAMAHAAINPKWSHNGIEQDPHAAHATYADLRDALIAQPVQPKDAV